MKVKVAIPSNSPGGLEAEVSMHFGHADAFTLVTVEDGSLSDVEVLPGIPHEQGGCLAPVSYLAGKGARVLVAGGMGMRPLMGFFQAGIDVFHNPGLPTVGQAAQAFAEGRLARFGQDRTCGGGGGCEH
jgi:predicted Fe-Mo cluster-binding NifX family protein